jgi:2,3-bisphosphoglycerate-independent phosphoglycerate mutase
VPFLFWGKGFEPNGAKEYTEAAAKRTGLLVADGYKIMGKFLGV